MERFYCDVLGFYVTDRLGNGDQEMLFLSRSLLEHHQIVLAPGRSETSVSTINQVSFEIETLRKLIEAFQALTELGSIRNGGHEPWRKLVAVCPRP